MEEKSMLVLCYLGPVSWSIELRIFEHLGYKLTVENLNWETLSQLSDFDKVTKMYPNLLTYDFARFDVITILICDTLDTGQNFIITKEFVDDLKQAIQKNCEGKDFLPPLIGMNGYLSGNLLTEQAEYFDGLFLGQGHNLATIQDFFEKLESKH